MFTVEAIAEVLEAHKQRATYGAVARFLGVPQQSLMSGYPKTPRFSFIVNQKTELPTGYSESQMHRDLRARKEILTTERELADWLKRISDQRRGS